MEEIAQHIHFFQRQHNINLSHAFEINSGLKGPHIVFVGATHGNEPAGVTAILELARLISSGNITLLKGKITCILGNPEAYRHQKRFIHSNLNRAFIKELTEDHEGKRAKEIRTFFVQNKGKIDAVIDLHSVSVGDFTTIAYFDNLKNRNFALQISNLDSHFVITKNSVPGSVMEDAIIYGNVPQTVAVECGNHYAPTTPETAMYHIISALKTYNMVPQFLQTLPIQEPEKITIYKTLDIIKPLPDFHFVDPDVVTGTFVKKGKIFATHINGSYQTNQDCYIVMPDKNPSIYDHDAGFLCSKEIVQLEPTKAHLQQTHNYTYVKSI